MAYNTGNIAFFSDEAMQLLMNSCEIEWGKRREILIESIEDSEIMTRSKLMEKFDISATTLAKWEQAGLQVLQAPFENNKKKYYRMSDVINFLTVE